MKDKKNYEPTLAIRCPEEIYEEVKALPISTRDYLLALIEKDLGEERCPTCRRKL